MTLCQTEPDIQVVSTVADSLDLASLGKSPHIVLIDGQDIEYGLLHVKHLKQNHSKTQIILLVESLNSKTIWEAARAGAAGCIRKGDSAHSLLQTLHSFYEQSG